MESGGKDTRVPTLGQNMPRAPWLHATPQHSQERMHPLLVVHKEPLAAAHATGASSLLLRQFGMPAWPAQTSAEPLQMASVDMLVLPETTAAQSKASASSPAEVKVTFSSAEDLAEALFPRQTKTGTEASVNQHTHEALMDHRDHLRTLNQHKDFVHEALLEHRKEILNVRSDISDVDAGLVDHRDHLRSMRQKAEQNDSKLVKISADVQALQRQMSSLAGSNLPRSSEKELRRLQEQVAKLNQNAGDFDQGLRTQKQVLDEHARSIQSHSRLHDALGHEMQSTRATVSKLSQSLEGRHPSGVEQRVRDLQQSLHETQAELLALKPRSVMMDTSGRKVDVVVQAPRKR